MSPTVMFEVSLVLFAIGVVAWPVFHAVLLWEGLNVFGSDRRLRSVLAAVVLTPLVVASSQVALSFVGSAIGLGVVAAGVSVLVGVGARTLCYRTILDLPSRAAFGMALGVSVLSWIWGAGMATFVLMAAAGAIAPY